MSAIQQWQGGEVEADRNWARLERTAKALAASSLVPAAYRRKPDDILIAGMAAEAVGLPLTVTTLSQFYVIDGRVAFGAQLMIALAGRSGHEVWVDSSDSEQATVAVRRKDSANVQRFTFTMAMARAAKLADKDVWKKYPEAMLLARAATKAVRTACPDVLLGLESGGATVDIETGEITPPAGGNVPGSSTSAQDGGERAVGVLVPSAAPPPDTLSAEQRLAIRRRALSLGDEWAQKVAVAWRTAGLPPTGHADLCEAHLPMVDEVLSTVEAERDETHGRRCRAVHAKLGEVGVTSDDARHELIREATGGATQSSAHLTGEQYQAVVEAINALAAEDGEAAPDPVPPAPYAAGEEPF